MPQVKKKILIDPLPQRGFSGPVETMLCLFNEHDLVKDPNCQGLISWLIKNMAGELN